MWMNLKMTMSYFVFSCNERLKTFVHNNYKYDSYLFKTEKISESFYKIHHEDRIDSKFFITREQFKLLKEHNVKTDFIIFMDFEPEISEENIRKQLQRKQKCIWY